MAQKKDRRQHLCQLRALFGPDPNRVSVPLNRVPLYVGSGGSTST